MRVMTRSAPNGRVKALTSKRDDESGTISPVKLANTPFSSLVKFKDLVSSRLVGRISSSVALSSLRCG